MVSRGAVQQVPMCVADGSQTGGTFVVGHVERGIKHRFHPIAAGLTYGIEK